MRNCSCAQAPKSPVRQRSLQKGRQRFSGEKEAGPWQRGQVTVRGEGVGSSTEAQLQGHISIGCQSHSPLGVFAQQAD